MMTNKTWSFIFSFGAHVLLLFLIFSIIKLNHSTAQGEANPNRILSYLYQEKSSSSTSPKNTSSAIQSTILKKDQPRLIKTSKPSLLLLPKKILTKKSSSSAKVESKANKIASKKSGNHLPISQLLALLHAAIQKHQHYPASALQLEREGNTTVNFTLFPDGHIEKLKMITASGTNALDEAALLAVKNASPFSGVDRYLTDPQEYQITVSFELT